MFAQPRPYEPETQGSQTQDREFRVEGLRVEGLGLPQGPRYMPQGKAPPNHHQPCEKPRRLGVRGSGFAVAGLGFGFGGGGGGGGLGFKLLR